MCSLLSYLVQRETGNPGSHKTLKLKKHKDETEKLLEYWASFPTYNKACTLPGQPRSTFLMSFSPDKTKVASTHGDHTVRVSDVATGRCRYVLKGHPRTPWCVAFHPGSNDILATGCLGGEVRIWDLLGRGCEKWRYKEGSVITSLTFHPMDSMLVFATETKLFFWNWSRHEPIMCCQTQHEYERIRLVRFGMNGHFLYTGIANGTVVQQAAPSVSYINNSSARQGSESQDNRRLGGMYNNLIDTYHAYRREMIQNQTGSSLAPSSSTTTSSSSSSISQSQPSSQTLFQRRGLHVENLERPQASQANREFNYSSRLSSLTNRIARIANRSRNRYRELMRRRGLTSDPENPENDDSFVPPQEELPSGAASTTSMGPENTSDRLELDADGDPEMETSVFVPVPPSNGRSRTSGIMGDSDGPRFRPRQGDVPSRPGRIAQHLYSAFDARQRNNLSCDSNCRVCRHYSRHFRTSRNISHRAHRCLRAQLRNLSQPPQPTQEQNVRDTASNYSYFLSATSTRDEETPDLTRPNIQFSSVRSADVSQDRPATDSSREVSTDADDQHASESLQESDSRPTPEQGISDGVTRPGLAGRLGNGSQTFASITARIEREMNELDRRISDLRNTFHESIQQFQRTGSINIVTIPDTASSFSTTDGAGDNSSTGASGTDSGSSNVHLEEVAPSAGNREDNSLPASLHRSGSFLGAGNPGERSGANDGRNSSESESRTEPCPNVTRLRERIFPRHSERSRPLPQQYQPATSRERLYSTNALRPVPVVDVQDWSEPVVEGDIAQEEAQEEARSDRMRLALGTRDVPSLEGHSWHALQRHHLHPHYSVSILDDTINRPTDALQSAIHRAIAGAYIGRGEPAVANNIINQTHRIQMWDFTGQRIPDISDAETNVLVPHCKLHNEASWDISEDNSKLVTFVPSHRGFPDDTILAVFSLRLENRGQCLYTKSFGPNAISVSLSPKNNFVVVGLAARRLSWVITANQTIAQIYKLDVQGAGEKSMKHITDVSHPCGTSDPIRSHVSVNSVRWLPLPGQGIIYATNKGDLFICKPGMSKEGEKEIATETTSTSTNTSIRRNLLHMLGLSTGTIPLISIGTQTDASRSMSTQTD